MVTKGRCECILVGTAQFRKHGKCTDLHNLTSQLESRLPSNKEAFKKYMLQRKWENFKAKVVKEVMDRALKRKTCLTQAAIFSHALKFNQTF